jgi:hypothetical protein
MANLTQTQPTVSSSVTRLQSSDPHSQQMSLARVECISEDHTPLYFKRLWCMTPPLCTLRDLTAVP